MRKDYTIAYANRCFRECFGSPAKRRCYQILYGRAAPCEECAVGKDPAAAEPLAWDWLETPDNRAYRVYSYPLANGREAGLTLEMGVDITARVEAERRSQEYLWELENSNQELEEFAYAASHDLQEPLRKIVSFGNLLQSRYGGMLDEKGQDYLGRMERAARRMRGLIDSLLEYSRLNSRKKPFQPVDLNALLTEVISDMEGLIQKSAGRVTSNDLVTLRADPHQISELLQNLISNGLKFNHSEQPAVHIEGKMVDVPPPEALAEQKGAWYQLVVSDNGIGFAPEMQERIFVPFQRLHGVQEYEGSGIGLSICHRVVTRHGGTITAESAPGGGSTFTITLPVQEEGISNNEAQNCHC